MNVPCNLIDGRYQRDPETRLFTVKWVHETHSQFNDSSDRLLVHSFDKDFSVYTDGTCIDSKGNVIHEGVVTVHKDTRCKAVSTLDATYFYDGSMINEPNMTLGFQVSGYFTAVNTVTNERFYVIADHSVDPPTYELEPRPGKYPDGVYVRSVDEPVFMSEKSAIIDYFTHEVSIEFDEPMLPLVAQVYSSDGYGEPKLYFANLYGELVAYEHRSGTYEINHHFKSSNYRLCN
jgi:hypothetical protein